MNSNVPSAHGLGQPIDAGEWAGWQQWTGFEAFENHAGPFFSRREENGAMICGLRVDPRHMNGGGVAHGGSLMTFADYAMFQIAYDTLRGWDAVTVSMSCEFLAGAPLGALLIAKGEVMKAGKSLLFVRGLITHETSPVLSFSGVIRIFRPRT